MSCTEQDIELVRRHTNYTEEDIIRDKIAELNTAIDVITEYLKQSKTLKPPTTNTTPECESVSINQEIYKQIRNRMKIHKKTNG